MKLAAALLLVAAAGTAQPPRIGRCTIFPEDNIWNTPVDTLPVDKNSAAYINSNGADRTLHPDFGSGLYEGAPIGIPFIEAPGNQPRVPVTFEYADESDPGPYPIPPNAPIEGGPNSTGDRHILVLDRDNCVLYEVFAAYPAGGGGWRAGSGAIFPLNSHKLRPLGWTSADAAGLPILPGLARYDEVAGGEIRHALRLTVPRTRRAYVWPATHFASNLRGEEYPPMGQRFRLRADFDITGFPRDVQVILRALKKFGLILADNGSSWYISGAPDERWNNDVLRELRRVRGSDLEAVDVSSLMIEPTSGQVRRQARAAAIVNAASYLGGAIAPGEIISIFGDVGSGDVFIDGAAAAVLGRGPGQINAVVPAAVAGKSSVIVEVRESGAVRLRAEVAVAEAAPGVFTLDASGAGPGAILNQDSTVNSSANPCTRGSVIQIFGTGAAAQPVAVRIGGLAAAVLYAGAAPGYLGLDQVNALVPAEVASGPRVPLLLIAGRFASQPGVTVAVR